MTQKDLNVALHAHATASSTMHDNQHEARNAVDGDDKSYWASAPGQFEATFGVFFGSHKTIKQIIINWKFPAKKFEVYILKFC